MGIFESTERPPVQYLPTGDRALLIAWVADGAGFPSAILCVEDGSAVLAALDEFKFDYRYATNEQRWFDVSRIEEVDPGEDLDGDTDQEDADDGGPGVPG